MNGKVQPFITKRLFCFDSTSVNLLRSNLSILLENFLASNAYSFVTISFENKAFNNGRTYTGSVFGITGNLTKNNKVRNTFTLKVPATALKTCVFSAPSHVLFTVA